MTDQLTPTKERLSKADHLADDGKPTQEKPYARPQRLGTAWDRYSRTKDAEGKPIADDGLILTRAQIGTGELYLANYIKGMWGGPVMSRFETGSRGSVPGVPAHCLDAQKRLWRMQDRLKHAPYLVTLVDLVLIDGLSAEDWAKRTGRPEKHGIAYFRVALDLMGGEP